MAGKSNELPFRTFRRRVLVIAGLGAGMGIILIACAAWVYFASGFREATQFTPESHRVLREIYSILVFALMPSIGAFLLMLSFSLRREARRFTLNGGEEESNR